jgi:hypothetical protein
MYNLFGRKIKQQSVEQNEHDRFGCVLAWHNHTCDHEG